MGKWRGKGRGWGRGRGSFTHPPSQGAHLYRGKPQAMYREDPESVVQTLAPEPLQGRLRLDTTVPHQEFGTRLERTEGMRTPRENVGGSTLAPGLKSVSHHSAGTQQWQDSPWSSGSQPWK